MTSFRTRQAGAASSGGGFRRRTFHALRRLRPALLSLAIVLVCSHGFVASAAGAKRVVVIKVDGLPHDEVERFVRERDQRTGKSLLPWFDYVFYERGTRVANFYVRGMSLSGPSWSLLDTGQHLQIRGNVEFDRYTLHSYDYLNFIPFWIANVGGVRVDMPGVELLDEMGLPLVADAYPYDERHLSFQLYQRGTRWTSLQRGLQNRFTSRTPRELFDEWNTGFEARSIIMEQMERELLEKLNDPKIRYLDFYTTDYDHAAHHNHDRLTHLRALQELDALIGRVWMAIQKTPQAADTALVLVSDHGTNSDERVYSQGYNLVKLLGSAAGGGHHVITKRRLMSDYALKGIYPLVPLIYTTTEESFYLKGQSTVYPTALVDFDGNERASIHLRDSDLNLLHILLQQLRRESLPAPLRRAATDAFFSTIDRRRAGWERELATLNEELAALRLLIEKQRALVAAQPKKWTAADRDAGRDKASAREFARLDSWTGDERDYVAYARTVANLLALKREGFDASALRFEDLLAPGAMGEHNDVHALQNYVVGLAPGGLALAPDGSLDMERSFARVDYFALLGGVAVRNNVQTGVESRPVDFVAVRIPAERIRESSGAEFSAQQVIWLDGGRASQALILSREDEGGRLYLRYLPIENLKQDADGRVTFRRVDWRAGLPLKIWEDADFALPSGEARAAWLDNWHTDIEWLRAAHRTRYSNGIVGLHEQLARHSIESLDASAPNVSQEERTIRRFRLHQRRLVETDLLILANDHWNFDVRGFNPGGNHGSFFRVSTHSTLMLAGGANVKIPKGLVVEEPYDSLSFVPTLLALTGQIPDGRTPVPALWQKGFRTFPGRVIGEIFNGQTDATRPVADTQTKGNAP
ncbi:MAG TPA: alkaline phosphatase family protein [Pyrinomonadaceae bacterium]|nr:alkaline phosphatase family protein [Pyrinomonadaceae bacterium]